MSNPKKDEDKKVVVNDNCIGCWACVAICWEVFDLNDEWRAFVKDDFESNDCDCIEDAIWVCPVWAIEQL